jgi:hypothetical protein
VVSATSSVVRIYERCDGLSQTTAEGPNAIKPFSASVRIDRPREDVFSFLDVLANHEQFTDHMLVDWSVDGPAAGVGGKARMRVNAPGEQWMEMDDEEG